MRKFDNEVTGFETVVTFYDAEVRIVKNLNTSRFYIEYVDTDGFLNTVKVHFGELEAAKSYVEEVVLVWLPVNKISI